MILVLSMLAMLLPSEIGSIIAHAAENHFAVVAEKDFTIQNGVVKSYDGSTTDVVIPDGTTSIAEAAFYFDENITSVTPQAILCVLTRILAKYGGKDASQTCVERF